MIMPARAMTSVVSADITLPSNPIKKALQINPGLSEVWFNRGNVLDELGRWDDAIESFDKAIAIEPGFPVARKNREFAIEQKNRALSPTIYFQSSAR